MSKTTITCGRGKVAAFVFCGLFAPGMAFSAASTPPVTPVDLTTTNNGSVVAESTAAGLNWKGEKAFNGIANLADNQGYGRWLAKKADNMYVVYKFNAATTVDAIGIYNASTSWGGTKIAERAPNSWTLQGSNDNSTWVTLDTQSGETGWGDAEYRYYKFDNTTPYLYYKFNCTTNNGETSTTYYLQLQEIEFYFMGPDTATWTGGGESGSLADLGNWTPSLPGRVSSVTIDNTGETDAEISEGVVVYNHLYMGTKQGTARLIIEGGEFVTCDSVEVGSTLGGVGEIMQTGGNSSFNNVYIGYENGQGVYELTGGCSAALGTVSVGRFGTGRLLVAGLDTVLTTPNVRVGYYYSSSKRGTGTLAVTNGGEIATAKIYGGGNTVGQATVMFDGGKLTATANSAEFLKGLLNIELKEGGLVIDTQGYNLTIANCTFNVTPGGKITVIGGGTVTFTNVTLNLAEIPRRSFVFAETDGVFSGAPTFSGNKGKRMLVSDDNTNISVLVPGLTIVVY